MKKLLSLSALFSFMLAVQPAAQAEEVSFAVEQMAEIMINMESQPTDEAKTTLQDIAADNASTNNEKKLAATIMNVDRKVRPDDKAAVMKIWISPSASESERSIAKAILKFDDKLDNKNKGVLSGIVYAQ